MRERPEDILPLAHTLLAQITATSGQSPPGFTAAAKHALKAYSWPGNIRELKKRLERACLMYDGRLITYDVLFERPAHAIAGQQDLTNSLRN